MNPNFIPYGAIKSEIYQRKNVGDNLLIGLLEAATV